MQMIALFGWTSFPPSWKKRWMFTQNAMENVKSLFWRPQPTLNNPLAWPCHIYYPVVPRPRRGPLIPTMENGKALSFAYPHPPKTILLASSTRVAGTVCSLIAVLWKNLLSPQQLLCLCLPHLSPTTIWPTWSGPLLFSWAQTWSCFNLAGQEDQMLFLWSYVGKSSPS